ncbi:MAG: flavodoxin [Mobilitalea sp.]
MKSVIIYYSLEGNTDFIAKKIAKITGADLVRLEPVKEYPSTGFKKYFWGGKSVTFNETPKLKNEAIDLSKYDSIIIGTPIWAGSFTPPILTFLTDYNIQDKNVYLFASTSGGDVQKCFDKMEKKMAGNKILATTYFIDPLKSPKDDTDEKIKQFCLTLEP